MRNVEKTVDETTKMSSYSISLEDHPELREFLAEDPKNVEMMGQMIELVTSAVYEANQAEAAEALVH